MGGNGDMADCKQLPVSCITCSFDSSCIYGEEQMVTCNVKSQVVCNVSDDA